MHHALILSGTAILAVSLTLYPPVWPLGAAALVAGIVRRRDRRERAVARRRAARGGWIS